MKEISSGGATVSTKASDVHTSFGGLQAFYQAPEADQLFATTKPVSDLGLKLSSDMCTIAGALGTYSRDAAPVIKKLEKLKAEAEAFRTKVADDEKWREDGSLIDENLDRRNEIAEVWEEFHEVERAAHAKIVALVGGKPLRVNDGSNAPDMYGYDAEAMKQAKSLPWGDAVEESIPGWQVWEHVWEYGKGFFVDGVWGTLKGLGGLVGLQGWDTFKQSWAGLAKLGTGLSIAMIPGVGALYMAVPDDKLPAYLRESRTAMKETGKALLAWDQWGSNPGRAAGAVTFNVITTIATGGTGGAVSGAGKAGAVAKALSVAGKAGHVVDPMTYVFKGAGAGFSKIGDVMAGLKGAGKFEVPSINLDGVIALPDGAVMLPDGAIHLPSGAAIPEGAVKLPDGNIKLPEGTTTFPPGTVKLPVDGPPKFMDPKGNIYDADGAITQHVKDAPKGRPDAGADVPRTEAPKVDTPATAKVPERDLVGARVRGGDNGINLGSDISDPVHTLDHASGGHAPDNMPRNDLNQPTRGGDTPSPTGVTHPDTPSTAGARPDGPGSGAMHGDGSGTGGTHPDGPGTGGDHLPDSPGTRGVDDLGHGADDAVQAGDAINGSGARPDGEPISTERRKELQNEHVRLANEDPAWFKKHYHIDGHRVSKRALVDGVELPILKKDADGNWISKHDMPHGPSEIRYGAKHLGPDTAPPQHLGDLNAATANRKVSMDLTSAQKAFDGNASTSNANALAAAQKAYDKQLPGIPNNSKIAERLGERAAELHVIPNEFKNRGLDPITLPKTPNGANMFDAVYALRTEDRYLVVEAKAPKGDLDWRNGRADPEDLENPNVGDNGGAQGLRVKQGTRPYLRTIFAEMMLRGGEDARIAKLLRDALKEGRLDYVLVKAKDAPGSTYAGALMERMKID
ncbi:hypothetical protein [Streptomyces yangpuensis]|uniref:hypothetical protein n=1 Tax=Streptomyces yangpuensis TaxID=1648182 RepID=UPI001F47A1C8|nr:hypothetical protein [Streptomyces yangpuensis]